MVFDPKLWGTSFNEARIPPLPCPTCRHGRLVLVPDTIQKLQAAHNVKTMNDEDSIPEMFTQKFALFLKCSTPDCGEIVSVYGDTRTVETYDDDEFGQPCLAYVEELEPKGMYPAPPIIELPEEIPYKVRHQLQMAFGFLWTDIGASANRVRASIERILDDAQTPVKANSRTDKLYRLDLAQRIEQFKIKAGADHADTMTALRYVGNLGSHGEHLTRDALLDAFRIYEDALAELYGNRSTVIKSLREKIISTKGRYSSDAVLF
jgi:hypothetical protein